MRKLFASIGVVAVVAAALAAGAGMSDAGGNGSAMMQAVPPESVEPATVTVSNVDDLASRCEEPHEGNEEASPEVNGGVEVSVNVTGTNGFMQADTVTPDGMGDWSLTYNGLTVGTYTVTASCDLVHSGNGANPAAAGPFTYVPVQFVVTAPAATAPAATAGGTVVAGSPSFTG